MDLMFNCVQNSKNYFLVSLQQNSLILQSYKELYFLLLNLKIYDCNNQLLW